VVVEFIEMDLLEAVEQVAEEQLDLVMLIIMVMLVQLILVVGAVEPLLVIKEQQMVVMVALVL
jgi:heme/copper-type cytochrome/quinol oxidase subunit 2